MWTCRKVGFAVPADHMIKLNKSGKRDKYLDLAREMKKYMKHEGDYDTKSCLCTWNNPQKIGESTGRLGNKRTSGDTQEYLQKSWRFDETCCHLNSNEKASANAETKNKIIIETKHLI